jgi:hypothetical protein
MHLKNVSVGVINYLDDVNKFSSLYEKRLFSSNLCRKQHDSSKRNANHMANLAFVSANMFRHV